MKVEVKNLERGRVELTIELDVEEYKPFLQKATGQISQITKIEGFRPGKASFDVVKKHVGENKIWQEALEPAVKKTFLQALDEKKLITVGSPQIDIVKLAPGNPVIYKATVGLLPEVKLPDYTKIKVKTKLVELKDDEIEKKLTDLQKMLANEILVDRAAKTGDKVEIDFTTYLDKIPISHGDQKKFPLVIGESTFIPGFEEQLIDMEKNQTKDFQLKFPENYHDKKLAGKLADFKVKLNAVYQLDLPKLDNELAKRLGNFESLVQLKETLTKNLKDQKQQKEDQRLEEEILDKLIEKSSFGDIPDILVDSETKKMFEELKANIANQGMKIEDYLTHLKKTQDQLLLDFVTQAIKRIKSAIMIREIVKKENIEVESSEIEEEIEKSLEAYGNDVEVKKQLEQEEYKNYLGNILTSRKALDHLKSAMVED